MLVLFSKTPMGRVLLRTSRKTLSMALVVRIFLLNSLSAKPKQVSRSSRSSRRHFTAAGYLSSQTVLHRFAAERASLRFFAP